MKETARPLLERSGSSDALQTARCGAGTGTTLHDHHKAYAFPSSWLPVEAESAPRTLGESGSAGLPLVPITASFRLQRTPESAGDHNDEE